MKYKLRNKKTKEIIEMSLPEILKEINRDRSDEWTNYDKDDWREGLKEFTEYKLICASCNKKEPIEFEDIGEGKYCQECLDREINIIWDEEAGCKKED